MHIRKPSYLKFLILLILSVSFPDLRSQIIVQDTSLYYRLLKGPDVQENLDYALIQASSLGYPEGIDWLIRHGANADFRTAEGVSPILFAVASGQKETVRTLLEYDPELDYLSNQNESPLMVAVKDGNIEIAELLLRDSANVNFQTRQGYSSLHFAAVYGDFYMVDMLLYYEADVNLKSADGTTPLMVAVYSGNAVITDLLLQNRAHVLDADKEGFTSFMIAAQTGDTLLLDMLLKRGADRYAVNKHDYDALCLAIKLSQREAVEFLLKRESGNDTTGRTRIDPYRAARVNRRKDMAEILRKYKVPESVSTGFDQVTFSGSVKVCAHDYYTGFAVTFREPVHNIGIFGGFDFKPSWTRVIVKQSENLFYQYMDKSYLVYGGVLKELSLTDNTIKGNWFFSGAISAGYNFGNEYKGTEVRPDSRIRLMPAAGFRYNKNTFNFQIGIEYTNTGLYKIGPVWIRTGISYNLDFDKARGAVKILKW